MIYMKKYIFAAAVLTLGIRLGLPDMAVMAEEPDVRSEQDARSEQDISSEHDESAVHDDKTGRTKQGETSEKASDRQADVSHLQVPQKLHVVIDPWEMDGQGQIYSERYVIKNTGKTEGTLTLSGLACKTGGNSNVVVKDQAQGLHDEEEKSVYMEMLFGDDDKLERVVLSKRKSVYKVKIKPGEELPFIFSGEVNENASEGWKDGDLDVTVTYSWKPEELEDNKENARDGKDPDSEPSGKGKPGEEEKENLGEEDQLEGMDGPEGMEKKDEADEAGEPGESENGIYNIEETENVKDKVTELQEAGETELVIDSWKADGDGKICSAEYTMRNAGKADGTLVISEFFCKTGEQSGIAVRTGEETDDGDGKSVYMEMVTGNGERIVVPREKREDSRYEVKLKAGEEVTFRFVGELDGIRLEELKKGDIVVTAACSWNLGETL